MDKLKLLLNALKDAYMKNSKTVMTYVQILTIFKYYKILKLFLYFKKLLQ